MTKKHGEFTSKYGPTLPLGAIIEIDGAKWEVVGVDGDQFALNRVVEEVHEPSQTS